MQAAIVTAVFHLYATIDYDVKTGHTSCLSRLKTHDPKLHPNSLRADSYCMTHDRRAFCGRSEDVDQVYRAVEPGQIRVTAFAENLLCRRIHRNDAVTKTLEIVGNEETCLLTIA